MSEDKEKVIQLFGGVQNPQLAEVGRDEAREKLRDMMLKQIDVLRAEVAADRVAGIVFVGVGMPGHQDLQYMSEDAVLDPTPYIACMEILKTRLIAYVLEDREVTILGDEDDED